MLYIQYAIEKISRKIKKTLIRYSSDPRPSSYPFISGDGFRAMSQHIFEKDNQSLNTEKIAERDIVFVQSDMIPEFFHKIHPKIKNKYILITHNGDRNISESDVRLLDNKIVHWFAQNLLISHPKITPIPIGLENAHYWNAGRVNLYKNNENKKNKNGRILVAFSVETNRGARYEILEQLKKNPLSDILSKKMTQKRYIRLLKKYSYVASPPGNGIDCHRTWEALCVGTVPIVSNNYLSDYFIKSGVPMVMVDSWDNINIDKNYFVDPKNVAQTKFDYWKDIIYKYKE